MPSTSPLHFPVDDVAGYIIDGIGIYHLPNGVDALCRAIDEHGSPLDLAVQKDASHRQHLRRIGRGFGLDGDSNNVFVYMHRVAVPGEYTS